MNKNNTIYLTQFKNYLQLAGMSPRTVAIYCSVLSEYLDWIKEPTFATTQDLINFALTKKSNSARKQTQGVFKHFYRAIIYKPKILTRLPRIKKARKLPVILSEKEMQ